MECPKGTSYGTFNTPLNNICVHFLKNKIILYRNIYRSTHSRNEYVLAS